MQNVFNHFIAGVVDGAHIKDIETIYDKPIKCWVKSHKNTHFTPRWLKAITGGYFYCYTSASHDTEPEKNQELKAWSFCTFKDPSVLTYEPLEGKELFNLKGKWLVSKGGNIHSMVTGITTLKVTVNGTLYSNRELFETWNYEDGTPVGKRTII